MKPSKAFLACSMLCSVKARISAGMLNGLFGSFAMKISCRRIAHARSRAVFSLLGRGLSQLPGLAGGEIRTCGEQRIDQGNAMAPRPNALGSPELQALRPCCSPSRGGTILWRKLCRFGPLKREPMIRAIRILALLIALGGLATPVAKAAEAVDLLLVLAADVSRSVDHAKFKLQREGYAAAIADRQVLEAISSGMHQRIALCFVEWSGSSSQKVLIEWTVIGDAAAARQFGDRLLEAPRAFADRTSISGGLEFAMAQLERAPFQAARRTIDVSGDGTNNSGRDVALVRDQIVEQDFNDFGQAIVKKLVAEIAMLPATRTAAPR